jgi:hypothetical protein
MEKPMTEVLMRVRSSLREIPWAAIWEEVRHARMIPFLLAIGAVMVVGYFTDPYLPQPTWRWVAFTYEMWLMLSLLLGLVVGMAFKVRVWVVLLVSTWLYQTALLGWCLWVLSTLADVR